MFLFTVLPLFYVMKYKADWVCLFVDFRRWLKKKNRKWTNQKVVHRPQRKHVSARTRLSSKPKVQDMQKHLKHLHVIRTVDRLIWTPDNLWEFIVIVLWIVFQQVPGTCFPCGQIGSSRSIPSDMWSSPGALRVMETRRNCIRTSTNSFRRILGNNKREFWVMERESSRFEGESSWQWLKRLAWIFGNDCKDLFLYSG